MNHIQNIECPDVIVTAGGTRENIDDVRYIGNFSGGRLGHALAATYADLGHRVLLLAPNMVVEHFGLPPGVDQETFTSAASLQDRLLGKSGARLILHAAAVADYSPDRLEGKVSSDEEELIIHLKRTPKILPDLRDHFGDATNIVGFKLLSGVSEEALIAAATQQIATSRTNLCIANDLQELGDKRRVHIVQPTGEYSTLYGHTQEVAAMIAQAIPVEEPHHV